MVKKTQKKVREKKQGSTTILPPPLAGPCETTAPKAE